MPLYNYKCSNGHEFEEFNSIADRATHSCEQCNKVAEQTVSTGGASHSFKLGEFEHIASEPVYVKRKSQLKALCRQHKCYAPGVLD